LKLVDEGEAQLNGVREDTGNKRVGDVREVLSNIQKKLKSRSSSI
jgi:hypothetical protein